MKTFTARSLCLGGWIVAALSMPVSAFADGSELQAETAQADMPTNGSRADPLSPSPSPSPSAPVASRPLQGGVTKLEDLLQATESTDLYKVAVKKLTSGVKLTAEEYRSLGVGCIGLESDRTFFQNIAIVSDVYPDSPAARAGLRKGDRLIDNTDNDEAAIDHPEIPRWKVTCGQAGSQKQVTVLRHDKPITITLTRMNIEDIADDKRRHEWEQIISKLGNPEQGEFEGIGKNPLTARELEEGN